MTKDEPENPDEEQEDWQGSICFEQILQTTSSPTFGAGANMTLPAWFIREHSDKIRQSVVLRPTETKRSWTVQLGVYFPRPIRPQVKFSRGWWAFADFNGLAKGDLLVFCLTGISEFDVYIYRKAENPNTGPPLQAPEKSCSEDYESPRKRTKTFRQYRTKHSNADTSVAELLRGGKKSTAAEEEEVADSDSSDVESLFFEPHVGNSRVRRRRPRKNQVNECEESALGQTQKSLPCFLKRLRPSNLRDAAGYASGARLEIPRSFVSTHGRLLRQNVKLQGVHEGSPVRNVGCEISEQKGQIARLYLRSGWSDFVDENDLQKGQVLIFTLTARSFFVVKEVPTS